MKLSHLTPHFSILLCEESDKQQCYLVRPQITTVCLVITHNPR